jgi:hypothetical protein
MRNKKSLYDDQMLESMKRYYKIESYDELLQYISINGLRRAEDKDYNL